MKSSTNGSCSPHEDTAPGRKALAENYGNDVAGVMYQVDPPVSPLETPGLEQATTSEGGSLGDSWGPSAQPYAGVMPGERQQLALPPFYGPSPVYSDQVAHAAYHYPNTNYPNDNWQPPMIPSMGPYYGYYGQGGHEQCPPGFQPAPTVHPQPQYQALESLGSLSSYSSSDGNAHRSTSKRRHNKGRRQRHSPRNGGGPRGPGTPPDRGWYRFDDSTTLYQMRGRILEIAKDRDGSKFIQRRLRIAGSSEVEITFEEALEGVEELWNDVYGNYILQALLEIGSDDMRERLGRRIVEGDVVMLSTKAYGCRLIQKALDTLSKDDVANIVACVRGRVKHLVHDHNGNHVIQRSVTRINELIRHDRRRQRRGNGDNADDDAGDTYEPLLTSLDIIVDEVTGSMKDLALHPYGCRVVQRLVEHCTNAQRSEVLDSIVDGECQEGSSFGMLVEHEYGNYVIQKVVAYGRPPDRAAVFEAIAGSILKLSRQRHSSNVVEMMLTYGDMGQRCAILEEILNCYCVDQSLIPRPAAVSMAGDAYANYVCKTALDVLRDGDPQRARLCAVLLAHLAELEKSPFAKQVVLRIKSYARESTFE